MPWRRCARQRSAPPAVLELLVHVVDVVDDDLHVVAVHEVVGPVADARPQVDVLGPGPAVDDHQDVVVAEFVTPGVLHPIAARVAAVQDDHLHVHGRADHLDDGIEVPPLPRGQVLERVLHRDAAPYHTASRNTGHGAVSRAEST
jgi:hypothetical protein